jgi:uncharacterized protein (TIGR02678 family)
MRDDPQHPGERTAAARSLLVQPWRTAEADPALFALIRRHGETLDRWFTQRLGYRLIVHGDTSRLVKTGHIPADRPLRTHTDRPFTGREYVTLALVLAATASGPDRISLRDLVLLVRSAAADAGVALVGGSPERRALVTALRWLISQGVMRELDRTVAGYESDDGADALLEIRNDRLALLAAPPLVGAESAQQLLARAAGEGTGRAAARRRLVEDPVIDAADLTPDAWSELRRRFREEIHYLEEMFGFVIEARAEGVAAIDVEGGCSDQVFPRPGTVPHAALLLLHTLVGRHRAGADTAELDEELGVLIHRYGRYWSQDAAADPGGLRAHAVDLLAAMGLVTVEQNGRVVPRPVAARYTPDVTVALRTPPGADPVQESLL